jgi:beta-phosphoglucomutase
MIEQCKLTPYIKSLVIGMECTRPKPFPDPYLEGMRRLGATAKSVIVFEDSETGMINRSSSRRTQPAV